MSKNTETMQKAIVYYLLIKLVFGVVGIFLQGTAVSYLPYISYLFGDGNLYSISIALPVFLVLLTGIAYYGMRKSEGYARVLAIPILVIDLFSFPVGTILSVVFIAYLASPLGKYEPMPRGNLLYRGIGASLIAFSIIGMLGMTGGLSAIQSAATPTSVEAKIMGTENLTGPVRVIIELNLPTASPQGVQAQDVFVQDVETMGGTIISTMSTVDNLVVATVDASQLATLAQNPNVKQIIQDTPIVVPIGGIYDEPVNMLDTSYKTLDVQPLWNQNLTGKGVVVAVVDTGINAELPIFQRDGKSIVIDSLQLYGEHVMYHGTACASCIASQDKTYRGIAPGVSLLNVEVFPASGSAYLSDIMKGWDWVANWKLAHPTTTVICSNSIGANPWLSPSATILNGAASNMVTKYNIPMVVAAGNSDWTFSIIQLHVNCPGESKNVLTVGAVSQSGQLAPFSCRGTTKEGNLKPDVVAPGVSIHMFDDNGNKITESGTSFATPLTAGVLALIAQEHPDFTAIQLQQAIKSGASSAHITVAGLNGTGNNTILKTQNPNYGYGLVDAVASLAASNSENAVGKPAQTYNAMMFIAFPFIGGIIFFVPELKKRKW